MSNGQPGKMGGEKILPAPPSPGQALPGTESKENNPPIAALTPEEQMALYEKELKETDWGHQPC